MRDVFPQFNAVLFPQYFKIKTKMIENMAIMIDHCFPQDLAAEEIEGKKNNELAYM